VIGTTQDEAQLGRIGAERARALIDLTHTNQATLDLCRLASERFEIPIVISRIGDVDLVPQLQAMGVKVVQPALATAMALEGALRYPTVFDVLVHESPEVEVGEVILANASLVNLRVREVRLPGNALIVSLERDATIMVPHGDTKLKMGDRIDLIGSPDAVQRSADLLRG
jgi:CPA2 family monovalent cation:H+ antiporter-2